MSLDLACSADITIIEIPFNGWDDESKASARAVAKIVQRQIQSWGTQPSLVGTLSETDQGLLVDYSTRFLNHHMVQGTPQEAKFDLRHWSMAVNKGTTILKSSSELYNIAMNSAGSVCGDTGCPAVTGTEPAIVPITAAQRWTDGKLHLKLFLNEMDRFLTARAAEVPASLDSVNVNSAVLSIDLSSYQTIHSKKTQNHLISDLLDPVGAEVHLMKGMNVTESKLNLPVVLPTVSAVVQCRNTLLFRKLARTALLPLEDREGDSTLQSLESSWAKKAGAADGIKTELLAIVENILNNDQVTDPELLGSLTLKSAIKAASLESQSCD